MFLDLSASLTLLRVVFQNVLRQVSATAPGIFNSATEAPVAAHPELSKYGVTISYGIAEFDPVKMFEVEDLVEEADRDLYRVKKARGKRCERS